MEYITYFHGYPIKLGNKYTGWISCYQWERYGLRTINAIIAWAYHNIMCYFNIRLALKADKIIFISHATKKHFIEQAKRYRLTKH